MKETLLYVALDRNDAQGNLTLADTLVQSGAGNFGFKVNLDHALLWGADYIASVVGRERPVFVDLKMNNGPRTMSNVVRWLGELGVAHTNIWAHAESNLARTVAKVADVADRPTILATTFYTRWNEKYAKEHHGMSLTELISHWAYVAVENGAEGIICPGNQMRAVEDIDTVKLNPAIRIGDQQTISKQEQTVSPYDAVMYGADILVVGSPIYGSPEPVETLKSYLAEMQRAESDIRGRAPS